MSRSPLQIGAVAGEEVQFSTGGPLAWVSVPELDSTRLTIRRFGVAYLKRNAVDEADIVLLHNAIRKAHTPQDASARDWAGRTPQDAP